MEEQAKVFLNEFKTIRDNCENDYVCIKRCRKLFNKFIRNVSCITTGFLDELESICPGFLSRIKIQRQISYQKEILYREITYYVFRMREILERVIKFSDSNVVYGIVLNYNRDDNEEYMNFKHMLKTTLCYNRPDTENATVIEANTATDNLIFILPEYYQQLLEDNEKIKVELEQCNERINKLRAQYSTFPIPPIMAIYDFKNERYVEVINSPKIECKFMKK